MNRPLPSLKFCGLTVLADLVMSLKLKIEYVGFNFWPRSKRFLPVVEARNLWIKALTVGPLETGERAPTQAVGLLVDPGLDQIKEVLREFPEIAGIQLHGSESVEFVQAVKDLVSPRFVWKALPIKTKEDAEKIAQWVEHVEFVLLDALVPSTQGGGVSGGLGVAFDWTLLEDPDLKLQLCRIPWGLAGGIHVHNFTQAAALGPSLIDICSGIEVKPGVKDPGKMQAIVRLRDENH